MKPFTLMVPCSTSTLGSGFDAIGIALAGPGIIVRARPGGEGLRLSRIDGEGHDTLPRDGSNRMLQAARLAAVAGGRDPALLAAEVEVHSSIPLKRGLGSSAAAAVAGAMLADQLLEGAVGPERIQQVAVELEGHPDNVVPCLHGGAQVSVRGADGRVLTCEIPVRMQLRAAIYIPDQQLETAAARAALARQVPLADAVYNLGRSALLVAALGQGRLDLLGEAMEDRLHQPPRTALLPWLPELIREARAAGAAGAALSGAGTTVFALCPPESARVVAARLKEVGAALGVPGRGEVVEIAVAGAQVLGG